MGTKIARGQITIIDQNDAPSIQTYLTSSSARTIVFAKDSNIYNPLWGDGTASSVIVTVDPMVYFSNAVGDKNLDINYTKSNVIWTIVGGSGIVYFRYKPGDINNNILQYTGGSPSKTYNNLNREYLLGL